MDSEIIFNCLSHVSLTTYFAALCRKYKKKNEKHKTEKYQMYIYRWWWRVKIRIDNNGKEEMLWRKKRRRIISHNYIATQSNWFRIKFTFSFWNSYIIFAWSFNFNSIFCFKKMFYFWSFSSLPSSIHVDQRVDLPRSWIFLHTKHKTLLF